MTNAISLGENESIRALHRFVLMRKKGMSPHEIHAKMGDTQYNLAESEIISRSGDPDRYDPKTGNFVIWP